MMRLDVRLSRQAVDYAHWPLGWVVDHLVRREHDPAEALALWRAHDDIVANPEVEVARSAERDRSGLFEADADDPIHVVLHPDAARSAVAAIQGFAPRQTGVAAADASFGSPVGFFGSPAGPEPSSTGRSSIITSSAS